MASYLGRNVNLALLVIIIGVVIALVGTTVFFQRSLQNRTSEHQTTSGSLSECKVALENYMSQTNEAQEDATRAIQDIRKYDQLYEQKSSELKESLSTIDETQKQLAFEKLQREKLQQLYQAERNVNAQLNQTIIVQERRIEDLKDDLRDARNECNNN